MTRLRDALGPDDEPGPDARSLAASVPRTSSGQQHHGPDECATIDPTDDDPDYVVGQLPRDPGGLAQ